MCAKPNRSFLVLLLFVATGAFISSGNPVSAQGGTAAADVEAAVQNYYYHIKMYDHEAMLAAVTPEFELVYSRGRVDRLEFETRHRAEVAELGPTESRPGRMDYQNVDFEIEIDGDLAYSRSRNINPAGYDNFDYFVLRRDGGRWRIHRFFHMPIADVATK
jgi:hypothetical protein